MHSREENIRALKKIASLFVAVIVIYGGTLLYERSVPKLDDKLGCPLSGAVSRTIVVLDKTDVWSDETAARIGQSLRQLARKTTKYSRLSILEFNGVDIAPISYIADACNPGNVNDGGAWVMGENAVENRFLELYERQIIPQITKVSAPDQNSNTALIELVEEVLKLEEGTDGSTVPLYLVLLSDMRQNSDKLTFYQNGRVKARTVEVGKGKLILDDAGRDRRRILQNNYKMLAVDIWYIKRPGQSGEFEAVRQFWNAYFDQLGAATTWQQFSVEQK